MSNKPLRLSIMKYQIAPKFTILGFAIQQRDSEDIMMIYCDSGSTIGYSLIQSQDKSIISTNFVTDIPIERASGFYGLRNILDMLTERNSRDFVFEGMWKLYNRASHIDFKTFSGWAPYLTSSPEPIRLLVREDLTSGTLETAHLPLLSAWILYVFVLYLAVHRVPVEEITGIGYVPGTRATNLLPGADLAVQWVVLPHASMPPAAQQAPRYQPQVLIAHEPLGVIRAHKIDIKRVIEEIDFAEADLSSASAAYSSAARYSATIGRSAAGLPATDASAAPSSSTHPSAAHPPLARPPPTRPSQASPLPLRVAQSRPQTTSLPPKSFPLSGKYVEGPPVASPAAAARWWEALLAPTSSSRPLASAAGASAARPAAAAESATAPFRAGPRGTPPRLPNTGRRDKPSTTVKRDPPAM